MKPRPRVKRWAIVAGGTRKACARAGFLWPMQLGKPQKMGTPMISTQV
jgi:hypothetical protein